MAVESGVDYALAPKITWIFETGVGNAFAIVVRGKLFVFPYNTTAGAGRKVTTTTVTVEGIAPVMAIQSLVGDPSTTPDSLLAKLEKWCQDIGKGPIIHDLDAVTEVKLRNGFFFGVSCNYAWSFTITTSAAQHGLANSGVDWRGCHRSWNSMGGQFAWRETGLRTRTWRSNWGNNRSRAGQISQTTKSRHFPKSKTHKSVARECTFKRKFRLLLRRNVNQG